MADSREPSDEKRLLGGRGGAAKEKAGRVGSKYSEIRRR